MGIRRIILYALVACLIHEATMHVSDVAPIMKNLFHAISSLTKMHTEAENVIDDFTFNEYSEQLFTQTLEELDIKYFDEVISDLQSRLSIPDEDRRAIMAGKHAKKNERNAREFVFRTSKPGRFLYGKVMTEKRRNGKEIDLAYAFYRVDFSLAKRQLEVIKRRSPFLDFLFGVHNQSINVTSSNSKVVHHVLQRRFIFRQSFGHSHGSTVRPFFNVVTPYSSRSAPSFFPFNVTFQH